MAYNYKDFERFHSGKMESREAADFVDWLETYEGEIAFQSWVSQQWEEVGNIGNDDKSKASKTISKTFSSTITIIQKFAAIALLIIAVVFVFYINTDSNPPAEFQTTIQDLEITKSAPKGKKTTVTLSDGTKIYLNSESSITYRTNFKEERAVNLTGEAFFEVVTDSTRPFKVFTGEVTTMALGTSFNINAYDEKAEILISLASGKIVVESNEEEQKKHFVNPGEGIGYALASKRLSKRPVNIDKITQWKSGVLQFESMPLQEVLVTLERWYGVEINIKDNAQIPIHRCTGKFKPNEYLSNVLRALSHSIEFDYAIKNKQVVIDFK